MAANNIQKKLAGIRHTIKASRLAKGFSQKYLAEQLNTTQNVYSKIERGEMEITLNRLMIIARALGLDVNKLLTQDEK